MATHSSLLAWRILWTGEPGRLQHIRLQSLIKLKHRTAHTRKIYLFILYIFIFCPSNYWIFMPDKVLVLPELTEQWRKQVLKTIR